MELIDLITHFITGSGGWGDLDNLIIGEGEEKKQRTRMNLPTERIHVRNTAIYDDDTRNRKRT